MRDVVIASAVRTPIGSFGGSLKNTAARTLGAITIKEAIKRAGIDPATIDEVVYGCVLQGGLGQNVADIKKARCVLLPFLICSES